MIKSIKISALIISSSVFSSQLHAAYLVESSEEEFLPFCISAVSRSEAQSVTSASVSASRAEEVLNFAMPASPISEGEGLDFPSLRRDLLNLDIFSDSIAEDRPSVCAVFADNQSAVVLEDAFPLSSPVREPRTMDEHTFKTPAHPFDKYFKDISMPPIYDGDLSDSEKASTASAEAVSRSASSPEEALSVEAPKVAGAKRRREETVAVVAAVKPKRAYVRRVPLAPKPEMVNVVSAPKSKVRASAKASRDLLSAIAARRKYSSKTNG